jgi:GNAT superfamily N-acetyltransferase
VLGDPSAFVYVAATGTGVVGFASGHAIPLVNRDAPIGRLTALAVSAGARGSGIGRALVEAVTEDARSRGCDRLEVTSGEHRSEAHRFYEHIGFEDRPRRFVKSL